MTLDDIWKNFLVLTDCYNTGHFYLKKDKKET